MNEKRIGYFDIAKGIGIICVIFGHMSIHWINRIVYTFHMPLFFFISGYFIKKASIKSFTKRKLRALIVPYLFSCGCILVMSAALNICRGKYENVWPDIIKWFGAALYGCGSKPAFPEGIVPIGALWFLLALFWALTIYNILFDCRLRLLFVILLAGLGYISARHAYWPWSIQSGAFALIFVHAGRLAREYRIFEKVSPMRFLCAAGVWLFCMHIDSGAFYLVTTYSKNVLIDIMGGLAGIYVVICVSQYLEKISFFRHTLAAIGRYSIIILCVHIIELNLFPWRAFWSALGIHTESVMLVMLGIGKMIWYLLGTWGCLKIDVVRQILMPNEKGIS